MQTDQPICEVGLYSLNALVSYALKAVTKLVAVTSLPFHQPNGSGPFVSDYSLSMVEWIIL
ncbi:hypothetical protein SD10_12335 [Spirosoma radiotolerans]|uniref:Uncharacterized protein n=1 Tax=Spirosoma radiotolerans TaxID=1379870 RepID=A0A0E3ZV33_9BACT|nr:hypothetical protein SD10_12335 [Spirosoma radiotolerans]